MADSFYDDMTVKADGLYVSDAPATGTKSFPHIEIGDGYLGPGATNCGPACLVLEDGVLRFDTTATAIAAHEVPLIKVTAPATRDLEFEVVVNLDPDASGELFRIALAVICSADADNPPFAVNGIWVEFTLGSGVVDAVARITIAASYGPEAEGGVDLPAGVQDVSLKLVIAGASYYAFINGDLQLTDDMPADSMFAGAGDAYVIPAFYTTQPAFPGNTDLAQPGIKSIRLGHTPAPTPFWTSYVTATEIDA